MKRLIDKMKHLLGVHKYVYMRRLSNSSHLLGCQFCRKRFVMNTWTKSLIDWDMELEDFHVEMGHLPASECVFSRHTQD